MKMKVKWWFIRTFYHHKCHSFALSFGNYAEAGNSIVGACLSPCNNFRRQLRFSEDNEAYRKNPVFPFYKTSALLCPSRTPKLMFLHRKSSNKYFCNYFYKSISCAFIFKFCECLFHAFLKLWRLSFKFLFTTYVWRKMSPAAFSLWFSVMHTINLRIFCE